MAFPKGIGREELSEDALKGGMVTLHLGARYNIQPLNVHRNVICHFSSIIRKRLSAEPLDGREVPILNFDEVPPKFAAPLNDWLYRGMKGVYDAEELKPEELTELWLSAALMGIPRFENDIMDRLIREVQSRGVDCLTYSWRLAWQPKYAGCAKKLKSYILYAITRENVDKRRLFGSGSNADSSTKIAFLEDLYESYSGILSRARDTKIPKQSSTRAYWKPLRSFCVAVNDPKPKVVQQQRVEQVRGRGRLVAAQTRPKRARDCSSDDDFLLQPQGYQSPPADQVQEETQASKATTSVTT